MRDRRALNGFWDWFVENESRLFAVEADRDALFRDVGQRLEKVDDDLTFEFGPVIDGRRDFVVSAAGLQRAFPAVRELVDAAPLLERWRIVPFRPRRWPILSVSLAGKSVDPTDVEVALLHNGKVAGLHIFIPEYEDDDSVLGQAIYLLLDEALGEYAVETQVGPIKLFPFTAQSRGERFPLPELPRRFDALMRKLGGGA